MTDTPHETLAAAVSAYARTGQAVAAAAAADAKERELAQLQIPTHWKTDEKPSA